jgi:ubiquinone/menaquinone biosynthesis C-methylase UbiE
MPEMPPQDTMFIIDMQKCKVKDFETSGWILDIGGGGEGIIGRLKGFTVIALDLKKEELEEAPAGPLKLIMDATKLQFLDNTFDTATAFFSLMYFTKETRPQAFQEGARVLKSGGRFHLWDVTIPPQKDPEKIWFVVPLTIQLPNEEVQTGYGVSWKGREQTPDDYLQLAQQNGLKVISQQTTDHIFYMEFEK